MILTITTATTRPSPALEVDRHVEARRLLDRHLGRLPASGDAIDIVGNVVEQTDEIDAVAHHRPRFRDLAERAEV